ncbi:uncharacterized protein [Oscarella lobularis]|uniref:uncharacterized protein n=1 Tax=Oscarella lobularis TaxID=121494 RepID=UPI0033144686
MPALLRWFLVLLACLFSWKGSCNENQIQFHLGNKTWTYGCEMETNSRDNNDNGKSSGDFGVAMENMSSCDPFFTRGCTPFSRLNEDKSPLYRISSARVHLEGGSGLRTNSTEVLFSMDDDDGDHLCNFTIKDEGKRLDIQCDPFVAGRYLIVRFKEAFDMMVCPVEENVSISVQTESLFLPIPIKSCVFQSNGTVSCPIRGLSSFNVTDIIVDIQYDNRSRGQLLAYASSQNVTREDENCTVRRQRNGQVHLSCNSPRRSEYVLLELPQGASLAAIQVYYIDDLGSPVVNMSVQWSGSVFEVNCTAAPPANSFWKSNVKLTAFWNGNFSKATLQGSVDFIVDLNDNISSYACEASFLGGTTVVELDLECQWTSFQDSPQCKGLEEVHGQQRKRNCTVTYGNNETETGQTRPERFCTIEKGNSGCNSVSEADTVILCSNSTETSITILLGTRIPFLRVALVDSNEKKPVSVDRIDTNVYRANSLAPFTSYSVTVNSSLLPPVIVTKKVSNLMVSHVEGKDFVMIKWNVPTLLKARPLQLSIYGLTFKACTAFHSCSPQPTQLLISSSPQVGTFEFNSGNEDYSPFRNYAVVLSADYLSTKDLSCFETHSSVPTEPPQNINASSGNPTQITVVWDPPPCRQQNGVILRYRVRVVRDDSNVVVYDNSTGGQQQVIRDLSPFTSYFVEVAAATVNGTGSFSLKEGVKTDEDKPSGAPLNVSASSITSTTFSVTWSPPAEDKRNGILTGYRININSNKTTVNTDPTFWTAENLNPASHYVVSVEAGTSKGFGPSSAEITVTTKGKAALVIARHHSFTKVPIAKEDFESYLEELGDLALREEFEWLPVEQEYPWESATEECNVEKNRYIDILPCMCSIERIAFDDVIISLSRRLHQS